MKIRSSQWQQTWAMLVLLSFALLSVQGFFMTSSTSAMPTAIGTTIGNPVPVPPDNDPDFGRMFPSLAMYQPPEALLQSLAASMLDPNLDSGDNTGFLAGFTYWGQFIDHDLTLNTTPLELANLDAIINFRTPRFDLDSMYGGGPGNNPLLYDALKRFLFATPNGFEDFQRLSNGTALVPELRNDENVLIAQIHGAFQKLHNKFIDQGLNFEQAQKQVQFHWQWIVVNQFLRKTVRQDVIDEILTFNGAGKPKVKTKFYKPGNKNNPMMPIEFSVAAYRFGHSQVRRAYFVAQGATARNQVFNGTDNDLHGSRVIPVNLKIDFANFFDLSDAGIPAPVNMNISRKIDVQLSSGLFTLPVPQVVPANPTPPVISLAERNLLRGSRVGLPSYQDVAGAIANKAGGFTPLTNAQMGLTDPGWGDKAPLWFGILKESEILENGVRLGPTGSWIVAEVFLGLMDADKDSYFNEPQAWHPSATASGPDGKFEMVDLLLLAGAITPPPPPSAPSVVRPKSKQLSR